jgi:site-specific DNA-cytosine methylase
MNYKVIGISSGIGVSLWPFREYTIGNVEMRAIFHSPKEDQWKANFPKTPLYRDLPEVEADIIISSPDCGSGSILRMSRSKSYGDHKQNDSLTLFFAAVVKYRPKFFLFENLDGLFKSYPEEEFDWMLKGYRLIKHSAPVSFWGNSQINRHRLVIVGIREDITENVDKYFRLPDYRDKCQTCKELYGDLEPNNLSFELGHIRESQTEMCTIHAGRKLPIHDITRIWQTELKGEKRWKVVGRKFTTAPGVYRNTKLSYPATARKANRQFDHHGLMLTPRQLARIQGVPDEFELVVKSEKANYWINKARAAVTKTPPMEISYWFRKKVDRAFNKLNQS